MIKAIKWGLLSCVLPLCWVHAYVFIDHVPGMVQPLVECQEVKDCLSPCPGWNAPVRLGLSHTEGKWYDVEVGYTSLETFIALAYGNTWSFIPFADMRCHLFNNGKWAANLGGGIRFTPNRCRQIVGANFFYDYRKSKRGHNFNQLGFGFEFLSSLLDIRLNFYFPTGSTKDKIHTHVFNDYIGPFWAICRDTRRALSGGDLEFGSWIVPRAKCQFVNLYGAIAPYYYDSSKHRRGDHHVGVYGVKGRLMTLLGEYFTLELRAGYDHDYRGMIQGILSFEIPLDKLFQWDTWLGEICGCPLPCRAYQPVIRQEMIVLSPKTCCWESNF